MTGTEGEQNYE